MPESKKKLTPQQMEDKIDEVWFEDRPTNADNPRILL